MAARFGRGRRAQRDDHSTHTPEEIVADIRVLDISPESAEAMRSVLHNEPKPRPRVAVVGLGYVGLPTALAMLDTDVSVIGHDLSGPRISAIESEQVDLVPADRERLHRWLGRPEFDITMDPARLAEADAVLICVPTPVDEHLVPDLRAVSAACEAVVATAVPGQTIVLTSTSYVGCTRDLLIAPLARRGLVAGIDVHVAFSPERIDPGNVRHPQQSVPRVIGGATPACARLASAVIGRVAPVHVVSSPEAAELTKLLENTFRAVNIALANEIGDISESLGLDVGEIIAAAATKPFGFMPFHPGIGVGGHCIACDPHYLLWQMRGARLPTPLIDQAMASIAARPGHIVDQALAILAEVGMPIRRSRILMVGVSYKPGVADVRESPAIEIISNLLARGAQVEIFDPLVRELSVDGRVLRSVAAPNRDDYDLLIVGALHPDVDYAWIGSFSERVIDPSGRARDRVRADRSRFLASVPLSVDEVEAATEGSH